MLKLFNLEGRTKYLCICMRDKTRPAPRVIFKPVPCKTTRPNGSEILAQINSIQSFNSRIERISTCSVQAVPIRSISYFSLGIYPFTLKTPTGPHRTALQKYIERGIYKFITVITRSDLCYDFSVTESVSLWLT